LVQEEGGPIRPTPTDPLQPGQEFVIFTPRPRFRPPTPYPSRVPSVDTLAGSEDSAYSAVLDQPSVTASSNWVRKDGVWKRNSDVSDTVAAVSDSAGLTPLLPSTKADEDLLSESLLGFCAQNPNPSANLEEASWLLAYSTSKGAAQANTRAYFERLIERLPSPALTADWIQEGGVDRPVITAGPGECAQQ